MEKRTRGRSSWQSLLRPARVVWLAPTVPASPVASPTRLIGRSLRASGLSRFLRAAACGETPVTIVVNDPHRATDSRSALLSVLEAADRLPRPPRFRLLVAAGSHAFGALERRRHERAMLGLVVTLPRQHVITLYTSEGYILHVYTRFFCALIHDRRRNPAELRASIV